MRRSFCLIGWLQRYCPLWNFPAICNFQRGQHMFALQICSQRANRFHLIGVGTVRFDFRELVMAVSDRPQTCIRRAFPPSSLQLWEPHEIQFLLGLQLDRQSIQHSLGAEKDDRRGRWPCSMSSSCSPLLRSGWGVVSDRCCHCHQRFTIKRSFDFSTIVLRRYVPVSCM